MFIGDCPLTYFTFLLKLVLRGKFLKKKIKMLNIFILYMYFYDIVAILAGVNFSFTEKSGVLGE